MFTVMNERLQQFLAAENITQAQFADSINVARAGVSHIIAGRNKPGYDFIVGMMKRYPDLNIEWLLTGRGKMFKSQEIQQQTQSKQDFFSGGLFSESSGTFLGIENPEENEEPDANNGTVRSVRTAEDPSPQPAAGDAKRRTAVKVVIFYDDNTFQEL